MDDNFDIYVYAGDGIGDNSDNCPFVFNPDQSDYNGDGVGDLCSINWVGRAESIPSRLYFDDTIIGDTKTASVAILNTQTQLADLEITDITLLDETNSDFSFSLNTMEPSVGIIYQAFDYEIHAVGTQDVVTYPDQDFTWTVRGEGLETWYQYAGEVDSQYVSFEAYKEYKTIIVPAPDGIIFTDWDYVVHDTSQGGADVGTYLDKVNNQLVIEVYSGGAWIIFAWDGLYKATYHIYGKQETVTPAGTGYDSGGAKVNKNDGDKDIRHFYAYPYSRHGGTISDVSYTVESNNPEVNVWLFGSTVHASTEYSEPTSPWEDYEKGTIYIDSSEGEKHVYTSSLVAPNNDTYWGVDIIPVGYGEDPNPYVEAWMVGNQLYAKVIEDHDFYYRVTATGSEGVTTYPDVSFTATVKANAQETWWDPNLVVLRSKSVYIEGCELYDTIRVPAPYNTRITDWYYEIESNWWGGDDDGTYIDYTANELVIKIASGGVCPLLEGRYSATYYLQGNHKHRTSAETGTQYISSLVNAEEGDKLIGAVTAAPTPLHGGTLGDITYSITDNSFDVDTWILDGQAYASTDHFIPPAYWYDYSSGSASLDFSQGKTYLFTSGDFAPNDDTEWSAEDNNDIIKTWMVDNNLYAKSMEVAFVDVTYSPTSTGIITNELQIFTNDPNSPLIVKLEGIGISLDTDGDGIVSYEEHGPNRDDENFDGNNDGISDDQQNNVASFSTVTGDYVTLASPGTTALAGVRARHNPSFWNMPPGVEMPYGFFAFELTGVVVGGTATATFYVPDGSIVNSYYKFGPTPDNTTPHWYEFLYDGQTGADANGQHVGVTVRDLKITPQNIEDLARVRDQAGSSQKQKDPRIRGWALTWSKQNDYAIVEFAPFPESPSSENE